MDDSGQQRQGEQGFSAVLTPHRSLSRRGFVVLMLALGGVSFAVGIGFLMMGAWPVFGFFGLDVALVYFAFRANYRAARLYELIDLTREVLTVTRVRPSGRSQSWQFNPYWVRFDVTRRPGRASELSLSMHGRRLVFGAFLSEEEKSAFARVLETALLEARGGVRI